MPYALSSLLSQSPENTGTSQEFEPSLEPQLRILDPILQLELRKHSILPLRRTRNYSKAKKPKVCLGRARQNLTSPRCRPKNFTLPTANFPRGPLFMGPRPPAPAGSLLGGRWSGLT